MRLHVSRDSTSFVRVRNGQVVFGFVNDHVHIGFKYLCEARKAWVVWKMKYHRGKLVIRKLGACHLASNER